MKKIHVTKYINGKQHRLGYLPEDIATKVKAKVNAMSKIDLVNLLDTLNDNSQTYRQKSYILATLADNDWVLINPPRPYWDPVKSPSAKIYWIDVRGVDICKVANKEDRKEAMRWLESRIPSRELALEFKSTLKSYVYSKHTRIKESMYGMIEELMDGEITINELSKEVELMKRDKLKPKRKPEKMSRFVRNDIMFTVPRRLKYKVKAVLDEFTPEEVKEYADLQYLLKRFHGSEYELNNYISLSEARVAYLEVEHVKKRFVLIRDGELSSPVWSLAELRALRNNEEFTSRPERQNEEDDPDAWIHNGNYKKFFPKAKCTYLQFAKIVRTQLDPDSYFTGRKTVNKVTKNCYCIPKELRDQIRGMVSLRHVTDTMLTITLKRGFQEDYFQEYNRRKLTTLDDSLVEHYKQKADKNSGNL